MLSGETARKKHEISCLQMSSQIKSETIEQIMTKLANKIDKQTEHIEKQAEQIEQLIKKDAQANITINSNVTSNVTNQTQNMYGINPFGKENLDFITQKQYNKIFEKGCRAVQSFVELIHCNENVPENRNIYIGNYKDEYIRTFNGKNWDVDTKEDVLYNLYNAKRDFLERQYKIMKATGGLLTDNAKYFFGGKYYENGRTPEAVKLAKDDIKNLLYGNRLSVIKKPKLLQNVKEKKIFTFDDYVENAEDDLYIPNSPMFKNDEKNDNNLDNFNYIPFRLMFNPKKVSTKNLHILAN